MLHQVREQAGVSLNGISGDQEAAITYFAARRWQGWGAGRILDFDIGGGSLSSRRYECVAGCGDERSVGCGPFDA